MEFSYLGKPTAYVTVNPDCTFEEFNKATGCPRQSWYDSRYRAKKAGRPNQKTKLRLETKFIAKNPNATYEEFIAQFGENRHEYVQARHRAKNYMKLRGVTDLIIPFRKEKTRKKVVDTPIQPTPPKVVETPIQPAPKPESLKEWSERMFKQPNPQDERLKTAYERDGVKHMEGTDMEGTVSLGTTPEFIWYESTIIRNDFERTMNRFNHLVRVMESRQADNNKVLDQAMREINSLRNENKSLTDLLDMRTKPGR